MEVGDLVKYNTDGDIGIITEVNRGFSEPYFVNWASGEEGYHMASEMEVINANR